MAHAEHDRIADLGKSFSACAGARQAMCERDKKNFKERLDKTFDKLSGCQKELKVKSD